MSKLNFSSNKDNILNWRVKAQLDQKAIRKIGKILLSLTETDIKDSKTFVVTVLKKDENENRKIVPVVPPQRNHNEDLEKIEENEINFDPTEQADSSDFENENDE